MTEALERALVTLDRATSFLGAGLRTIPDAGRIVPAAPIAGRYRAKVIGNGLRELDRFLNLLIDEALHARGLTAFPGQRNTANKLRAYRVGTGRPHGDEAQLRALGRSRECLFHCAGLVLRGDSPGDAFMTTGWPASAADDAPLRRVAVGGDDLVRVCAFYRRIGAEIGASVRSAGFHSDAPRPSGRAALEADGRIGDHQGTICAGADCMRIVYH